MSIIMRVLCYLFLISLLISCGKATKDDTEAAYTMVSEDSIQVHKFIDHIFLPIIERDTIVFLVEEAVFDWRGKLPESSMIGMRNLYHWHKFQQNSNRYSTREKDMSVLDVFSGEDEFQKVSQESFEKYTFQKSYLSSGIQLLDWEYIHQALLSQTDSLKEDKLRFWNSMKSQNQYSLAKQIDFVSYIGRMFPIIGV